MAATREELSTELDKLRAQKIAIDARMREIEDELVPMNNLASAQDKIAAALNKAGLNPAELASYKKSQASGAKDVK